MVISPYRTNVTAAHQDYNKRVAPDMRNGRAKPGLAAHHRALEKGEAK